MSKRVVSSVLAVAIGVMSSCAVLADTVDLEKIREAGLRTAIVNAEPIEAKVIADVFQGKFYSTSIERKDGEMLELSLVHEHEGVTRSYGMVKGDKNTNALIEFLHPEFRVGLNENDPQASKLLEALRLIYKVDNVFPHLVKRNGADVWTLVTGESSGGFYAGYRVTINAEMKPILMQYDTRIKKSELK